MQIPDALWRVTAPDAAPAQALEDDLMLDVAGHKRTAASVIIATNGYSDSLVKGLKRLVLPLYSTQMAPIRCRKARSGRSCHRGI
ncbi:hypothetical protein [uncultured Roseobacter sp.]|uniref:hypothetical protein n=1 Tax=uncultured Roseobacter sp. TaxID=114847 RepID=UPI002609D681|nr:hypothetical protein [uncultured Roseobacter sp.]